MDNIYSLFRGHVGRIAQSTPTQVDAVPEMELTNTRPSEGEWKIFKVPEGNTSADSFRPKVLSIGPYHHGSSQLGDMEAVKLCCRDYVLGRISEDYYGTEEIMRLANKARSCYSEIITMEPSNKFAEMLLIDGCFILTSLTKRKGMAAQNAPNKTAMSSQGTSSSDAMGHWGGGQWQVDLNQYELLNRHAIVHDLLLLENQIPFFVVEKINELAAGLQGKATESPKKEIAEYVEGVLHQYPKAIGSSQICSTDFHHLLHLCHMFFRPSQKAVERPGCVQAMIQRLPRFCRSNCMTNQFQSCLPRRNRSRRSHYMVHQWHRAVQYHEAGVEFREKGDSSTPYSLLDVIFSNGTMEIPHLSIDAKTESIFSNLIMFEKGHPHAGNYINAYVTFMSQLLRNAEDVDLLVRKGVIDAAGGRNEQVSDLFNRLIGLAVFDPDGNDYYLKSTLQSVEAHYLRRYNRWMAWFMQNYLKNPCVIIAGFLGLLVILRNIIQGPFPIMQYFKPRH